MAKAVVYTLLATTFIIFVLFYPKEEENKNHLGPSRRLGYKFPIPTFDPLVSQMERLAEEKGLGNQTNSINLENNSHIGNIADANEYFSDEGKLNITLRLINLFPLLDKAPKDEVISFQELEAWNIQQTVDRLSYRTQSEMADWDKDGDGAISFSEYLPQFSEEDIVKKEMGHGEAGWWKEQFVNADVDQNGSLNLNELNNFLHPEDSTNEKIQNWVLREKIKRMDNDDDGKLSFVEFLDRTYNIYKSYIEFETGVADIPTAEDKFAELDLNKDKFLEVEELKPIFRYLHPGELSYAKYYTSYLIHEADDNRDGKLTLDEMLDHEFLFYSTVYDENSDDYDEFHDEL